MAARRSMLLGLALLAALTAAGGASAQGEQRMVCSAGKGFGYVITFGTNFSRRICVTFKWLRGAPTSDAPPPGYCRWDKRAPTRVEARIRVFCQDLPRDFRIEKRGAEIRFKTEDAFYLTRLGDQDFRYFIYVRRLKRIYKVTRVGPWSR